LIVAAFSFVRYLSLLPSVFFFSYHQSSLRAFSLERSLLLIVSSENFLFVPGDQASRPISPPFPPLFLVILFCYRPHLLKGGRALTGFSPFSTAAKDSLLSRLRCFLVLSQDVRGFSFQHRSSSLLRATVSVFFPSFPLSEAGFFSCFSIVKPPLWIRFPPPEVRLSSFYPDGFFFFSRCSLCSVLRGVEISFFSRFTGRS